MPVINASGDMDPSLWIFKGSQLPCREVFINGERVIRTLTNFLSSGATVLMKPRTPIVNSENFLQWARYFVKYVKNALTDGNKVLMLHHGCRSHTIRRVLELLNSGGAVV